jgi:sugar phosphate isomerase/epimerase
MSNLILQLGVKTDPIEYRFSYKWLFQILAEESVHHVQLGTFCELYHLPDEFFVKLRRLAEEYGVRISSVFTSHRELGGFLRAEHPAWETVARHNYERLIEVGALVGAESVGSNPGAIVRDWMESKEEGIQRYLRHMKELMRCAHRLGVPWLTIEPMSCLAEPPSLPDEIQSMAEELLAYHNQHPHQTAAVGYCVDVAHGYADRAYNVLWDNYQLLKAALPYLFEIHLKNTDQNFEATLGFSQVERENGIVDVEVIRDLLMAKADVIPVSQLIGYLEIGGPKRGRDYSDFKLETELRDSLRYLRETFRSDIPSSSNQLSPS